MLYSTVHRTFSEIDHILGHKSNLYKFKEIKVTLYIPPDHNEIKLKLAAKKPLVNIQTHDY